MRFLRIGISLPLIAPALVIAACAVQLCENVRAEQLPLISVGAGRVIALPARILIVPLTLLAGLTYALEPGARRHGSAVREHADVLFTPANTQNLRSSG